MTFAGRWSTSFGAMLLTQDGSEVRGSYGPQGTEHPVEGTVAGDILTFRYREPHESGSGVFRLKRHGHFAGHYIPDSGQRRGWPWVGWRGYDGLWDSQLGRLRLIQPNPDDVLGFAESNGVARLEGKVVNGRLDFDLKVGQRGGSARVLADAANFTFSGEWLEPEQPPRPVGGIRVMPRAGLTWLVVVEAHWQRALEDNEFAFGHMLKELFARQPRVAVRHRFYHDEASLLHWCRQLLFLPEPTVLVIAGHGEANGLAVDGQVIPLARIVERVRPADGLELLHFSSCLVGQDSERALVAAPFPVSGYRTSVDWAQSALIEFVYFDMILEKGLAPERAAEQLIRLVQFAGAQEIDGSPYRPADFCFFPAAC